MRTGEQRESGQSDLIAPANLAGVFAFMEENTTYLVDEFVNTRLGEPFRLFPFGNLVKGGTKRTITPEMAAQFSLPHFKPPIKLGSHNDPTPAGGHIVELRVLDDGLYAVPEWNEQGEKAVKDGAYRYHSPEVIWADGALENPDDGSMIDGPLIVGDALLHMPHLGEAASLYEVKPLKKESNKMIVETVEVPKKWYDGLADVFKTQPKQTKDPDPEPVDVFETEEYKVAKQERDELEAKINTMEADAEKEKLHAEIVADLQDKDKFGTMYIELDAAQEASEMLASLNEEQREWVTRNFKAFIAQIDESNLTGEEGSSTEADDNPAQAFNSAIKAIQAEQELGYAQALVIATETKPELFGAYQKAQKGG